MKSPFILFPYRRIPVLLYHQIASLSSEDDPFGLAVTPENFRRQMKYLYEKGFKVVSLDKMDRISPRESMSSRLVALSFDDGYLETYTVAFPILKAYGFPATVFLITDLIGSCHAWTGSKPAHHLNWGQIREMAEHNISFSSHSCSHPDLTKLSDREVIRECVDSKTIIEENLGNPVERFAYPYGRYDNRVTHLVRNAGYSSAYAVGFPGKDVFSKERLEIKREDTFLLFELKASGWASWTRLIWRRLGSPGRRNVYKPPFEVDSYELVKQQKKELPKISYARATDVSVVIVTWNSSRYILECLKSIHQFTKSSNFEIIVVDNGSGDNSVQIIQNRFPLTRIFETGGNFGFAKACNLGIKQACGSFIFLLNPDAVIKSDVLRELKNLLESNDSIGVAGPIRLDQEGQIDMYEARELPSLRSAFYTTFGLRKLFPSNKVFSRELLVEWDRKSTRAVPYISGSAMMFRRETIEQAGLLDEQIPMYFEDLDFCERIRRLGREICVIPSAVVQHLGARSAELSSCRSLLIAMEDGEAPWLYFQKYRGSFQARIFELIVGLGSLLRLLALSISAPFCLFGKESALAWLKQNFMKSRAIFQWSISSRKNFLTHMGSLFAMGSVPQKELTISDPVEIGILPDVSSEN